MPIGHRSLPKDEERPRDPYAETAYQQRWAEEIMGTNFLGCEIAELHAERALSEYEKGVLRHMPYTPQQLKDSKNTHVLVAVPYDTFPATFLSRQFKTPEGGWPMETAKPDKVQVGWYLLKWK